MKLGDVRDPKTKAMHAAFKAEYGFEMNAATWAEEATIVEPFRRRFEAIWRDAQKGLGDRPC